MTSYLLLFGKISDRFHMVSIILLDRVISSHVYRLAAQKLELSDAKEQIYFFFFSNLICITVGSAFELVRDHPQFSQANRLKQIATQHFSPLLTGWNSTYSFLDVKGREGHFMLY